MNARICLATSALLAIAGLAGCDDRNSTTTKTTTPDGGTKTTTTHSDGTTKTKVDPPKPADNTANNKNDGHKDVKTPIDQSESSSSIKITADIRRAIMEDSTMSVNAQNVKIITDEAGVVTLRGVVNSQAEKDSVETKAKAVVGVTRVDNQLEIKTN